eukprot:COSAG02_NODE_2934_length_7705_cov_11.991191_4_plen_107_part_00
MCPLDTGHKAGIRPLCPVLEEEDGGVDVLHGGGWAPIASCRPNHIAVKAYQVPTCTGTRSPISLRLVCGRTPVATLGMWADPGIYLGRWMEVEGGAHKPHTLILFQ